MLAEELGVQSVDELKPRMAKLAEYEANSAAEKFVAETPDYYPVPKNGALIQNAMKAANMPFTVDSIRKVYESLRDKNLLEERPTPVDPWSLSLETLKAMANNAPIVESDTDF
jgi:hypothetical protein